MDYVITFADVMAGVVPVAIGALGFFIRSWFQSLHKETESIKRDMDGIRRKIEENDNRVKLRIDKLEDRTNDDIENIKKDLSGIKGEFATTFVQREDFFRSMNGMEDVIRRMDGKMDRLLLKESDRG